MNQGMQHLNMLSLLELAQRRCQDHDCDELTHVSLQSSASTHDQRSRLTMCKNKHKGREGAACSWLVLTASSGHPFAKRPLQWNLQRVAFHTDFLHRVTLV